jgi:hypothetical protein
MSQLNFPTCLRPRVPPSYLCSTSYESISRYHVKLPHFSSYSMNLLCLSGSAIPHWMYHALRAPWWHLARRRVQYPVLGFTLIVYPTRQFILQNDAFLVIRYHMATPDGLDDVLRILLQLSAYHIEVLPLSSGKSGAVSGEVCQVSFVSRVFR